MSSINYVKNKNCVTQIIADDNVVIYDLKKTENCFSLIGLSAQAWLMILDDMEIDSISKKIAKLTSHSEQDIQAEIKLLLTDLKENGLIKSWD